MISNYFRSLILAVLLSASACLAEDGPITVPPVPTATCTKDLLVTTVTATYSTVTNQPTGGNVLSLPAGFFFQGGAEWEFTTDTPGIVFCGVKYEEESIAQGAPAIKMAPDSKSFSLSISALNQGKSDVALDMTFSAGAKGQFCHRNNQRNEQMPQIPAARVLRRDLNRRASKSINPSSLAASQASMFVALLRSALHPATTSPAPTASISAPPRFNFIAKGKVPCNNAGQPPVPSSTNAQLVTACLANSIPTGMWSTLKVDAWASTIVNAASLSSARTTYTTATGTPTPDIGQALATAAGVAPKICAIESQCDQIRCEDVNGGLPKNNLSPVKFLAYNAYVGVSNMWYIGYNAVNDGVAQTDTGGVVDTFYDPSAEVEWYKVMSAVAPMIGIIAGVLGAIPGLGQVSGAVGAISASFGTAGAIGAANAGPTMDARLSTDLSVESWVKTVFGKSAREGLTKGYQQMMALANAENWDATTAGGLFAGFLPDTGSQSSFLDKTLEYITIKIINLAWTQSNNWVIRIPYGGPVRKLDGTYYENFSQSDCEKDFQTGQDSPFVDCTAGTESGAPGMARIFKACPDKCARAFRRSSSTLDRRIGVPAPNLHSTACKCTLDGPKGWDKNYPVPGGWTFDTRSVVRGSVESFLQGDFGFSVENSPLFTNMKSGKLTNDDMKSLMEWKVEPDMAGMFNLPVCEVWDVRSFPTYGMDMGRYSPTVSVGAKDKSKKFSDNVAGPIAKTIGMPATGKNGGCAWWPGEKRPPII
ncbi:MAG: hypothetical protein Q9227_005255 [Pyrenula ochraceoflavens]